MSPAQQFHYSFTDEALDKSLLQFVSVSGDNLLERVRPFHEWLAVRQREGVWPYYRVRKSPVGGEVDAVSQQGETPIHYLNFGSQDYLGLARHPRIVGAAKAAIESFGVHSAGSPAFAGRSDIVLEVEDALARSLRNECCLIYPTGWAAGCGVISGLARNHDTILIDQLGHNCLQEGARLCGAETKRFRHNDIQMLADMLTSVRSQDPRRGIFVVLEGLYSMDSDVPNLREILPLCKHFGATSILDVAHDYGSLGHQGFGILESLSNDSWPDIIVGSFSKTFASNGGFVVCSRSVGGYLQCFSSPFVFSNSISPIQAAVVREALLIAHSEEGVRLRQALMDRAIDFRLQASQLDLHVSGIPSAICPVFVGHEKLARATSRRIAECGLLANLAEFPAVPKGTARFRFQLMSTHEFGAIQAGLKILADARDFAKSMLGQTQTIDR